MVADNEVRTEDDEQGPFTNPMPALATGVGAALAALILGQVPYEAMGPVYFGLAALGLLATGIAVAIRPRSAPVLGAAALVALLASITGPSTEWDSARLVLRVLAAVAAVAAGLVLLPPRLGRIAFSLLLLFHFGGITVAVTSPSQGWLSNQLWYYVYRPYLQFMYLNNAYHFYAPEPGPTPMLWFCIEYEGNPEERYLRWVKVPYLDRDATPRRPDRARLWPNLEYTRRLSLAESANLPRGSPNPLVFQFLLEQRQQAAQQFHIPMRNDIYANIQYNEPNDTSKLYLQSYVRHVAHCYPHEIKPALPVKSVKVYKVIHQLILAPYLAAGAEPTDPTLYLPYYMGEFDPEGNLKVPSFAVEFFNPDINGLERRDPFLYWLIPIMRTVDNPQTPFRALLEQKITNYVNIHAGDSDEGDLP